METSTDNGEDLVDASEQDTDSSQDEHLPQTELTEPFDFVPIITIKPVINGVITIQITNCSEMWSKNQFESMHDTCFEFVYRRVKTNQYDKNPEIDGKWRGKQIFVGNIGYNGTLHLKVPVFLIDYDVEFFMRCRNRKTNKFMTQSKLHKVNISSFLLNNVYKVDDTVSFRNEETFYTISGKIKEVLDDNKFKIMYYKLNENYDPTQVEENENKNQNENDDENKEENQRMKKWIESYEIIDRSRIYHYGTNMQYEIDLINSTNLERNLLIKRNDKESLDIFRALLSANSRLSFMWCYNAYGAEKSLVHFEAMTTFLSKNIFDFLFEPEFNYKVDCLLDGDHHSVLNFVNLRQSDIRTKLELQRSKIGNLEVGEDEFTVISYRCDSCRTGLKDWNFAYQCSINAMHRHDYCLNCVNTVIQLNKELRTYMDDILNEDLNDDCIQLITAFVIGNVVCIKC